MDNPKLGSYFDCGSNCLPDQWESGSFQITSSCFATVQRYRHKFHGHLFCGLQRANSSKAQDDKHFLQVEHRKRIPSRSSNRWTRLRFGNTQNTRLDLHTYHLRNLLIGFIYVGCTSPALHRVSLRFLMPQFGAAQAHALLPNDQYVA